MASNLTFATAQQEVPVEMWEDLGRVWDRVDPAVPGAVEDVLGASRAAGCRRGLAEAAVVAEDYW